MGSNAPGANQPTDGQVSVEITLDLWPPSVNHIWRYTRSGVVLSDAGKKFYETAPWIMVTQTTKKRVFRGPVRVELDFYPPTRRAYDIDNRAKAVLDALVKAGVVIDDNQVYQLLLTKHDKTPDHCGEVKIKICPLDTSQGAPGALPLTNAAGN